MYKAGSLMPIQFKAPARFDATQVAYLRSEIERLAAASDHVVVDLARTEELDGSGVGAMVFAFKRLQARGLRLSIRNASGQPLTLLHGSGLLRTLSGEKRESRFAAAARRVGLERFFAAAKPMRPAGPVFDGSSVIQNAGARNIDERAKGAA
jgi:anti-anti-sigma regulatory factor